MTKCIGNEVNVYMLESNKLLGHVKWLKMMTVFSGPSCGDLCLNTGFKVSN